MAKFQPALGAILGSIGGVTFSHNKGGPYVKRRSNPTNPSSERQTSVRGILATLSSAWSLLTDSQREQWATWAAANPVMDPLGNTVLLTGQQAYIGLNARLVDAGTAANDAPPPVTGPPALTSAVVTLTAPGTISLAFGASPLAAGHRLMVWQSKPSSGGRDPNFRQCRLVGYSAAAATTPDALTAVFDSSAGQSVNFYASVLDEYGQISPALKATAVAA